MLLTIVFTLHQPLWRNPTEKSVRASKWPRADRYKWTANPYKWQKIVTWGHFTPQNIWNNLRVISPQNQWTFFHPTYIWWLFGSSRCTTKKTVAWNKHRSSWSPFPIKSPAICSRWTGDPTKRILEESLTVRVFQGDKNCCFFFFWMGRGKDSKFELKTCQSKIGFKLLPMLGWGESLKPESKIWKSFSQYQDYHLEIVWLSVDSLKKRFR